MPASEPLIAVRDLVKTFGGRKGFRALDGVTLAVGRGSVFGLLGPNGAGKTTLIKVLMGLVPDWRGEARLLGAPAGDRAARERVGFLPESHRLPGYLTGRQALRLYAMLSGKTRAWVDERLPGWLARVGMEKDADRKVREYSKGMQQRIGLAQALIHEPELVFLDEPTDGVDPVGRAAVRAIVADLRAKGVTVFINSHLLMEVERMCDRVVIMDKGKILREGTVSELTRLTGRVAFEVAPVPAISAAPRRARPRPRAHRERLRARARAAGAGPGHRPPARRARLDPQHHAGQARPRAGLHRARQGSARVNRPQVRALAADAFHQVLDNGVFRILLVLCAAPVLFTFLVGFREEGVVLLFGLKTWSYTDLFGVFGRQVLPADPRGVVIEVLLQLVLEFLAGSLGMLVVLSATSFFVPRLLEKGAAELYFHKPVSRAALFLSRYLAGLLFVALSSFVLVGGMALGLWLVLGPRRPGHPGGVAHPDLHLRADLRVHAARGVITRSTVAAPCSSFFFLQRLHPARLDPVAAGRQRSGLRIPRERGEEAEPGAEAKGDPPEEATERESPRSPGPLPRVSSPSARSDTLHFVLPKTTDADYLGQKLRRALSGPLYRDEDPRDGRTPARGTRAAGCAGARGRARLRRAACARAWERRSSVPAARLARHTPGRRDAERSRHGSASACGCALETSLAGGEDARGGLEPSGRARRRARGERFGSGFGGGEIAATLVTWHEGEGAPCARARPWSSRARATRPSSRLLCDAPGEAFEVDAAAARRVLASRVDIDESAARAWYPSQLALDAPLRFNILFSIGSTLLFAAAMLVLGIWRLARISF
jgi:ABC-2 type transport system ATP-binding protein